MTNVADDCNGKALEALLVLAHGERIEQTLRWMRDMGFAAPTSTSKTFVVMGKTFDPSKPDDYVQSFSIKRS